MTSEAEKQAFVEDFAEERLHVEQRLAELIGEIGHGPSPIEEAVRYMVLGGGKRLRPVLCVWTHDAFSGSNTGACLDVGCAIECLHTYSLIHDDLPCMDDDDMRRGQLSCHRKYGEAIAVLAGDALLTLCFDILATTPERWNIADSSALEAAKIVSRAAGTRGLIGGQVLDIGAEGKKPSIELVERIHTMKTAALISAAMEAGAVMAGAAGPDRERVREAGLRAGRAFQMIDDVLDVEGNAGALGKTPGKDVRKGKATYPSLRGVESSRNSAKSLIDEAIEPFARRPGARKLRSLLDFMVIRGS
jgi:geranylgeranyl diphosphate synthase type II